MTDQTPALCLVKLKRVWLRSPENVMGALFTCPFCGVLDTWTKSEDHVFHPSGKLMDVLGIEDRGVKSVG
jgi:hypothetical protein